MAGVAGRRPARTLIIVLMVVALVALLAGLFYFATPRRTRSRRGSPGGW